MNIAPIEVVAGDTWVIPVTFVAPDGTPRALAVGETPGCELYVKQANATYDLTADLQMTSAAAGVVVVPSAITAGILPKAPSAWQADGYPIRLHAYITDALGNRTTAAATPILAVDWRVTDLAHLQGAASIVAIVGPAGASGSAAATQSFAVNNQTVITANHALPGRPNVWIVDAAGSLVDADITYGAGSVTAAFFSSFTGTLYVR